MTKRQLVKWLEAKQSDARVEVRNPVRKRLKKPILHRETKL